MNFSLSENALAQLLKATIVLAVLTVVISSYIRLAETGVGCEPWPACYGQYHYNESAQGVTVLTEQGADSPLRFARISHRIITTLLGTIILYLFVISWFKKYRPLLGLLVPTTLLFLTIVLSTIGRIHPTQPLPLLTMANFTGGFLLLSLCYYLLFKITTNNTSQIKDKNTIWYRAGILMVVVQILWGGWTSANYAGGSCINLLSCSSISSTIETENSWHLALDNSNHVIIEEQASSIQKAHHLLAIVSLLCWIMLMFLSRHSDEKLHNYSNFMFLFLMLQFLIGIISLALRLPLLTTVLHNFLAALMIIFATYFNHSLSSRISS